MAVRFPYLPKTTASGQTYMVPLLPLELRSSNGQLAPVHGLLDSGAMVNVMPYSLGVRLGASWERQTTSVTLTGNLAKYEARALIIEAGAAGFAPVRLVFAWSRAEDFPLLLGQVNFFQCFDVCLHASRLEFEIEIANLIR